MFLQSSLLGIPDLTTSVVGSLEDRVISTTRNRSFVRQFSTFPEWQSPEKLFRFMQYSAAIYGYKMLIYESGHPWKSLQQLHKHTFCCSCCCCCCFMARPDNDHYIEQDNCCNCNMAAIKSSLPFLDEEDIVFVSFRNGFLETPFCVAIDRETSSVVVAIRGTLSIADVITDLVAMPRGIFESNLNEINGDKDTQDDEVASYSCHAGMQQAALYIYNRLNQEHILDKAFSRCSGHSLVITGHSLGAGTAAILAFMLKPKYPNLHCFAFGPPGGLLNFDAAERSKDFCVSVVVGSDIIPRTTIKAVHNLRNKMVEVLRDTSISKHQILSHGLFSRCCGSEESWLKRIEADYERIKLRRSSASSQDSSDPILVATTAENYGSTNPSGSRFDDMFPPGTNTIKLILP